MYCSLKMAWVIMYLLTLIFIISYASDSDIGCIGENGNRVDWYVLYKLPISKKSDNPLIRDGVAYMYISSSESRMDWKVSAYSVNDTMSSPGRTLTPIYQDESTALLYGLYNDQPPLSSASLTYGHTKGVIVSDGKNGFWLIHSVPGFPMNPIEPKTREKLSYSYPKTATRYGQSFLCISMAADQLNAVGQQLMYYRPKFYSTNVSNEYNNLQNLTQAVAGDYVKRPPWTSTIRLESLEGIAFTSYAKARGFGEDLYSALLAPQLKSDLEVETWSNGPGEIPSDCKSEYQVMDVMELEMMEEPVDVFFKNSQDHSKWAISTEVNATVCVGDINRMTLSGKRAAMDDPQFTGIKRIFNSETINGRANVSKATIGLTLVGIVVYKIFNWNQKPKDKS